ncbi:UNVERIFIED_CONTAM: hypothetical protein NO986_17115 [Comamonas sp. A-3]
MASTSAVQLARQTVVPCSADGYNVSASVVDRFGVLLAMVLGGVPLKIGNETLGAIDVAGAPGGHLDEACTHKAITALKDQLQQCRRHAAEKGLGSSLRAARPAKQAAAERSRQRVAPTFSRPLTSVLDLGRTDSEDPVAISHIGGHRHPDQAEDGHDSCHGRSFTSSIKSGLNAYI